MTRKIWTPSGDVPVGDGKKESSPADSTPLAEERYGNEDLPEEVSEEEIRAVLEQLRNVPVTNLIANQVATLGQVSAIHLETGKLEEARLAIDAIAGMLKQTTGRLGQLEKELVTFLQQLQMQYVQCCKMADNQTAQTEDK